MLRRLLIRLPSAKLVPKEVECAKLARINLKKAINSAAHRINTEYSNYLETSNEQIDVCEPDGKLCKENPCTDYFQGKQSCSK